MGMSYDHGFLLEFCSHYASILMRVDLMTVMGGGGHNKMSDE